MSASYLRKYATGTGADIYINIPKAGSANHAVSADWTPAAGDVKVSKDGGAAANIGTLPTAIAMGNSTIWKFVFTDSELTAAFIAVTISDSATKAVDDTGFSIETYGNASGQHAFDFDTSSVAQTGDSFARLGAPAGASVSADIAAIEAQTDDIGAAGAGLTAVPWNAAWDAEVQSEVDDALVAQRLDELLNADSDIDGAAPPTVGSVFHELLTKTAGSFTYDQTTDSLEALRDRGDAAWTTATGFSTHSAADVWTAAGRTLSDSPGFKKNTALANFPFLMIDSTDHVTPKTGLTVTATRSLDGAAFAACANAATEVSNGVYKISLAAGDLNGDTVTLRFTATGADDRVISIVTET